MDTLDMQTGLHEGGGLAVDDCHLDLVYGLISSHKPNSIIEFGVGSGRTTRTIIKAAENNENKPAITLVDSWVDFGKVPECIENYKKFCNVVSSDEFNFVFNTKERYDFIFSDADHWNTDKWFDYVYDRLLNPGGILIYHDVSVVDPLPNNELRFPNLANILAKCKVLGISHVHLDKSSKPGERCYRGLLVIFKSQLQSLTVINSKLAMSE
jgi:predicted O-methyltransferase YrrM